MPELKGKIIGNTFINIIKEEVAKLEATAEEEAEAPEQEKKGEVDWLLQGTLYLDVIESVSFKGLSAATKTLHDVGVSDV